MFEIISKIIEKSKTKKVDIGVAYEMIATEEGRTDELKEGFEFFRREYTVITTLNRNGNVEELKKVCELANEKEALAEYIEELKEKEIIE